MKARGVGPRSAWAALLTHAGAVTPGFLTGSCGRKGGAVSAGGGASRLPRESESCVRELPWVGRAADAQRRCLAPGAAKCVFTCDRVSCDPYGDARQARSVVILFGHGGIEPQTHGHMLGTPWCPQP